MSNPETRPNFSAFVEAYDKLGENQKDALEPVLGKLTNLLQTPKTMATMVERSDPWDAVKSSAASL